MLKKLTTTVLVFGLLSGCTTAYPDVQTTAGKKEAPWHLTHVEHYTGPTTKVMFEEYTKPWVDVLHRQPVVAGNGTPSYEKLVDINKNCLHKPFGITKGYSTPKEAAKLPAADCKNFAVCKYYALRAAGWSANDVSIWVGDYDHVPHQIVVAKLGQQTFVLDIIQPNVVPVSDYFFHKFQPTFRMNENGWDYN